MATRPSSRRAAVRASSVCTLSRFTASPPEQVAGTEQPLAYGYDKEGRPVLTREPKFALENFGAGKIENFRMIYGRRPYAAFGNSSSDDQQMLEYVKSGTGARLS